MPALGIGDQEQRCKQCLRSLSPLPPVSVGLRTIFWSETALNKAANTAMACLSIPEIETSWCQSNRWIILDVSICAAM